MKTLFILISTGVLTIALVYLPASRAAISHAFSFRLINSDNNTRSVTDLTFGDRGVLEEAGNPRESKSRLWWLDSGGRLYFDGETARTIQGTLPTYDYWRFLYSSSNPLDTDNGYRPQNIFRLISRQRWQNIDQQAYFKISRDNLSDSLNRNESNGLFLLSRYVDHDNFYYVGLRVDGAVVIKKKYKGVYHELAYKTVIVDGGNSHYDRKRNPSLLPKNVWLGLRGRLTNNPDDSVTIQAFIDQDNSGNWLPVVQAVDSKSQSAGPAIQQAGSVGIRTDFMDVVIRDYKLE